MMKNVFISYASEYTESANQIATFIEHEGFKALFDKYFLMAGQFWRPQLFENVELCDIFLFLISPEALDSIYCLEEYNHAVKHQKRFLVCKVSPIQDCDEKISRHQMIDFTEARRYQKIDPYQNLLSTLNRTEPPIYGLIYPNDLISLHREPTAYEWALDLCGRVIQNIKIKIERNQIDIDSDTELRNRVIQLFTLADVIRDYDELKVHVQHIAQFIDNRDFVNAVTSCEKAHLRIKSLRKQ
ncbi:MAG: toll/interleukin-1 receptor domain-containing protein [Chloroflexi bacterium]|nr:toll/interleukin-1 receptor domain-containing protein [Chloroflexota bacterium]